MKTVKSVLIIAALLFFLPAISEKAAGNGIEPTQRSAERKLPAPGRDQHLFGARLVRTATLLATGNKDYRQPVKILIYGQSIVGSRAFTREIKDQIEAKFPHADITVENKAIGGFGGEKIIRTAWHDLYPDYPDLIIFHVYGGEECGELEQLFTNIRRYTTSDVILMNHHLDAGSRVINEKSFDYLRFIANKYNCELVDISTDWVQYLVDNKLDKKDLLRDNVHPNEDGSWLLAHLIVRHLQYSSLFPTKWYEDVQTVYTNSAYNTNGDNPFSFSNEPWILKDKAAYGDSPKNSLKFTFFGNRVDIIAAEGDSFKLGSARIELDGKPISQTKGLYTITRPGTGPAGWWPAIMHIGHLKPLIQERWTMRIDKLSADSTVYYYSITGSKTGFDGSGNSEELFISNSQRVVIEPSDIIFNSIKRTFKAPTTVGFEVTWDVLPLFKETYRAPIIRDRSRVYKTTIIQGLNNGEHTIEIIPVGDGIVPIKAFEVHRPPLL